MRETNHLEVPEDATSDDTDGFHPGRVFADPVGYLEEFGIEAVLIEPAPEPLAPAA